MSVVCSTCGEKILAASEACQANGRLYHTTCFMCCSCGRTLKGKAFYNINGKVYCEEDYEASGHHRQAEKCVDCGHIILDTILKANGRSYHSGCFRCVICNAILHDVEFTTDRQHKPYCIPDYHKIYAPKCDACSRQIQPVEGSQETIRIVSMGKNFHIDCFHCADCDLQLTDEPEKRCYPLQTTLLCYACHIRRLKSFPSSQSSVVLKTSQQNPHMSTTGRVSLGRVATTSWRSGTGHSNSSVNVRDVTPQQISVLHSTSSLPNNSKRQASDSDKQSNLLSPTLADKGEHLGFARSSKLSVFGGRKTTDNNPSNQQQSSSVRPSFNLTNV